MNLTPLSAELIDAITAHAVANGANKEKIFNALTTAANAKTFRAARNEVLDSAWTCSWNEPTVYAILAGLMLMNLSNFRPEERS